MRQLDRALLARQHLLERAHGADHARDLYALADQWLPPAEIHPDGLPNEDAS